MPFFLNPLMFIIFTASLVVGLQAFIAQYTVEKLPCPTTRW